MKIEKILLEGQWQSPEVPDKTFQAENPKTRATLSHHFPVSSEASLMRMLRAAEAAAEQLRSVSGAQLGALLEQCAVQLEARREELVQAAAEETGLPAEPRLNSVEFPRTTNQLRLAAAAARQRSFCDPTIDTKNNLRSMYASLGAPVLCFGPNNFPFAFNAVMGGDFASILAAGNPVVAKAHPSHPRTSQLLAECALKALETTDLPRATIQMFYDTAPEVGLKLVAAAEIGAVAFTGSRKGGLALKAAADSAGKPVYLEMSSVNPLFVLPGALKERLDAIGQELAGSCRLGAGQFCTSPGLTVVIASPETEKLVGVIKEDFQSQPSGTLLNRAGLDNISQGIKTLTSHGAQLLTGGSPVDEQRYSFENTLLRCSAEEFIRSEGQLQSEVFGSVHLVVVAKDEQEMLEVAKSLEGNLTGCIFSDTAGSDEESYSRLAPILRRKVGRLLNDKMPTGVAVSPAMTHGGPFPATGHPGFTAVGFPGASRRFTALHCYDAVRPGRLPPELQDENPLELWRIVDGTPTQRAL